MSRVGAELCVGGAERSRISKSEKGRVKWSRVTYKKSLNVCLSVRVCRATEPIGWRYIYICIYFNDLAHMIVGWQVGICRAGLQAGNSTRSGRCRLETEHLWQASAGS